MPPRRRGWRTVALAAALALLSGCGRPASQAVVVVGAPDSPRLRQVAKGLEEGLAPLPVELVTLPPYGEEGAQTLRRLRAAKPPLFIALGTPALMMLAPVEKRLPVVFAMVANPYFSHAAWDPKRPEFHQLNVTGLASPPPVAQALKQAMALAGARPWGLLYDPRDGAALEAAHIFQRQTGELGLTGLLEETSGPEGDAAALERLLARGAAVLYVPPAATAKRYAPRILAWGRERRVLVVNGHPEISEPGAILTVTLDYEALGREAALLAGRVLAGESPAAIPIRETQPLRIEVDESLVRHWAGYPAPRR